MSRGPSCRFVNWHHGNCFFGMFLLYFWLVVSNIFYFHPYLGKIPNLTNIFQRGWNHQLVKVLYIPGGCLGFLNHQQYVTLLGCFACNSFKSMAGWWLSGWANYRNPTTTCNCYVALRGVCGFKLTHQYWHTLSTSKSLGFVYWVILGTQLRYQMVSCFNHKPIMKLQVICVSSWKQRCVSKGDRYQISNASERISQKKHIFWANLQRSAIIAALAQCLVRYRH